LVEQGDSAAPFFVVVSGELEIVRPSGAAETLVTDYGPGQFTGEVNMLSGRRALLRMRVTQPGEVIELDRPHLLALVQTDAELGEVLASVRWRNNRTGHIEEHNISHVFIMTGAAPNTRWLAGCVALDAKGFITTGRRWVHHAR